MSTEPNTPLTLAPQSSLSRSAAAARVLFPLPSPTRPHLPRFFRAQHNHPRPLPSAAMPSASGNATPRRPRPSTSNHPNLPASLGSLATSEGGERTGGGVEGRGGVANPRCPNAARRRAGESVALTRVCRPPLAVKDPPPSSSSVFPTRSNIAPLRRLPRGAGERDSAHKCAVPMTTHFARRPPPPLPCPPSHSPPPSPAPLPPPSQRPKPAVLLVFLLPHHRHHRDGRVTRREPPIRRRAPAATVRDAAARARCRRAPREEGTTERRRTRYHNI